jgi:hypothetical protein
MLSIDSSLLSRRRRVCGLFVFSRVRQATTHEQAPGKHTLGYVWSTDCCCCHACAVSAAGSSSPVSCKQNREQASNHASRNNQVSSISSSLLSRLHRVCGRFVFSRVLQAM